MGTMVYSYGAKAPLNPKPVLEQIWLANRYQNRLIEIERERRAARDAYLATVLPPEKLAREAELQGLIDASFEAIKKDRQKARAQIKMAPEQRQQVANWEAELKALKAELTIIRVAIRAAEGAAPEKCNACSKKKRCRQCLAAKAEMQLGPLGTIDRVAHQATLDARATHASGKLYHGTYIAAENAAKQSFAKTKGMPKFRRLDGTGAVGVQLQGGLPLDEIATGTRIQVLTMDQTEWKPAGPSPNLDHWRLLRLRIGSEGKRNLIPIWADFPFRMHRPLPPGAAITWVYVQRKRTGTTYTWHVQFTLNVESSSPPHPSPETTCGIDIGWRKTPQGLRAAMLTGRGFQEEIVLPPSVLAQFEKPCGIRAVRDKNFNVAVLLAQGIKSLWPEWLQEAGRYMGQWRAIAKLARVVLRWRDERFAGDEEVFPALEAWRKQDRHLLEMESHLRQRGQNARLDRYRNWALSVCRRYGRIILEGRDVDAKPMDLRPLAKLPAEDSLRDPLPQAAREHRTWAACSVLRSCLEQAGLKTGTVLQLAPARYTTMTCAACGAVDSIDRETLVVTCRHCAVSQDQDVRAALNLASAAVPPEPLGALALV